MAAWTETGRGTVAPWQCDTTEHFTIAFYFDRLDEAAANFADTIGLTGELPAGIFPRRLRLNFARELRAGASFHVDSTVLAVDPGLRLGHRFVDSASGEIVTWIEDIWEQVTPAVGGRARMVPSAADWGGPAFEERRQPGSFAGAIVTARGRARPADLDEWGRFSLAAFVHRFTDALLQACAAIGMTGDYMQAQRRGFSTFELILSVGRAPRLGESWFVETGIAHLGTSSLRLVHRMQDPESGEEFARLGQFGVQLDLDARRPAPLPEPIRAAADRLLLSPA